MSGPEDHEFRIGDVQVALGEGRRRVPAGGGALDAQVFPTLAAVLGGADFKKTLDELAGEARTATDPEVQAALQAAVRLLPVLKSKYGG